ncbi:MAG: hypothetical protein RIF32_11190 [Leptospirales bacterium]|jgi:hypothetical protein
MIPSRVFRFIVLIALILPGLSIVGGCSSSLKVEPAPAQNSPPGKPGRVCTLDQVSQAFVCDMDFQVTVGKTCASGPGLELEHEFLTRMTMVSLELLYLEGEAGSRPPFRYNSPGEVYARIQQSDCAGDANAGTCSCRFTYQDPELLQIFYHSAGCRRSSGLADNPLYFRGHGCY